MRNNSSIRSTRKIINQPLLPAAIYSIDIIKVSQRALHLKFRRSYFNIESRPGRALESRHPRRAKTERGGPRASGRSNASVHRTPVRLSSPVRRLRKAPAFLQSGKDALHKPRGIAGAPTRANEYPLVLELARSCVALCMPRLYGDGAIAREDCPRCWRRPRYGG